MKLRTPIRAPLVTDARTFAEQFWLGAAFGAGVGALLVWWLLERTA